MDKIPEEGPLYQTRIVISKRFWLAGAGGLGETGKCWAEGTELQLWRRKKSSNLMHSRVAAVNNSLLNTRNLLKE